MTVIIQIYLQNLTSQMSTDAAKNRIDLEVGKSSNNLDFQLYKKKEENLDIIEKLAYSCITETTSVSKRYSVVSRKADT